MFLAIYTNYVKRYCDKRFFEFVNNLGCDTHIVDNSYNNYTERLKTLTNYPIYGLRVPKDPVNSLFRRNVFASVDFLRSIFLKTKEKYFFILESDVIPPKDILKRFGLAIDVLEGQKIKWAAIGGLYHYPFHKKDGVKLQQTHHVLSGCTVYHRDAIEQYSFRIDNDHPNAFPDAMFCYDINKTKKFKLYNNNAIVCEHIYKDHEERGLRELYSDTYLDNYVL